MAGKGARVIETKLKFRWNHSEVIGLARERCTHCHGNGMRHGEEGESHPCNCVLRAVFRACYHRFHDCATREKYFGRVRLEHSGGKDHQQSWGMKDEEYMADFLLVTRRILTENEYRMFRFHFLLGADWKLCCRQMKTDRGTFFHMIYRLQQKLGLAFRELQPYSLYPLDEYFAGAIKGAPACALRVMPDRYQPMAPPLRKAA